MAKTLDQLKREYYLANAPGANPLDTLTDLEVKFFTNPPAGGGGATPANAIVTETAFGQASAIGTNATEFAREDHTHGTPAAPTIPAASNTVVTETTASQASNAGAAATFSRGDHTHGTPADVGFTPGAWTDITNIASGAAATVDITIPTLQVRKEQTDIVRIKGRLDFSGAPVIAAASPILTVPAAFIPLRQQQVIARYPTAVVRVFINTDGTLNINTATSAGTQMALDGITYYLGSP